MAKVRRQRSEAQEQVAQLLRTARSSLGLGLTFMTRMDGTTQHLEVVESIAPFLFKDGQTQVQETSLCQAILDGELPPVMPDLRKYPTAMALPAARLPRIRSYVSVPITLSDGSLYGTFCAAGFTADRDLAPRDRALMEVLAQAAAVIIEPGVQEQKRREEILARLAPVLAEGGPTVVLQPIVDLTTGHRAGAEALSRFPREWGKAPDVCFEEGHSVGEGIRLELMAIRGAIEHLDRVDGYVAMNVSPHVLLTPQCVDLLRTADLPRVLLELSEHDAVQDYDAIKEILDPLRADGMRLAIDDVGSGFSSLRHIVLTAPDVIKLDRSIVDGLSTDPVLATLVHSLVDFGRSMGGKVVAEGIETSADAATAREAGVDYGQGWFFGRPGPPEALEPIPAPAAVPAQRQGESVPEEGRHHLRGDRGTPGQPLLGVSEGHHP